MQIRQLTIRNFRGIEGFEWSPDSSLTCIVGCGDSCKSTILDAIEFGLSSRWSALTDTDFYRADTSKTIEIIITVGKLPAKAISENRMGLHLRGWRNGHLHDEPADGDEPVLTVKVSVDSTLEPVWELVNERLTQRLLSARDRALFGVVRLGGDADRHLNWGQGSALSRLGVAKDEVAPLLAESYRVARANITVGTLPALDNVADRVRKSAIKLGAYASENFHAALDTQRMAMSLGSLALHGDGIPLRLSGLGTRRLVALGIQQLMIPEGAIVLIDELEHGLEPHRIRHALRVLTRVLESAPHTGQVVLTTHASTTIVELTCNQLAVCRKTNGKVSLRSPSPALQALFRRVPEAFLSTKILVCEGKTEVGILRGLREYWAKRNKEEPIEARGVVLADGGGTEAVQTATDLRDLGYTVALLRDSDVALTAEETSSLDLRKEIDRFEWDGAYATEERIFLDVGPGTVQRMLEIAFERLDETSVLDSIRTKLNTSETLIGAFPTWRPSGVSETALREAIGKVAKKRGWFKQVEPGQQVGNLLAEELESASETPTTSLLRRVETWLYRD